MSNIIRNSVAIALLAAVASSGFAATLRTAQQKQGYALGAQIGMQFKAQGIGIDQDSFVQGFSDAAAGKKLQMTDKQLSQSMLNLRKRAMAIREKQMKSASAKNQAAENKFLVANAKKPGVVKLKSGLQYKILKAGKGPMPKATDKVDVDYEGTLINGTVFDSSYKRGKSATFTVNQVIKGWQQGLQLMHVGATWMLYIPSNLAYGPGGMPMGGIGPNSMLIFKVHLKAIK